MNTDETSKARGVLYGLAVGDALGRPTEFLTLDRIKKVYGEAGIRHLPEPAMYTDDTQMSLAVAEALYCFLRNPDSYEKTVLRGANTNGDSDTIACIAGAVSGAYLGVEAIPRPWVERIEKSDYLDNLAMSLARKKNLRDK